ncbi:MAG TPA: hypothetical protein VKF62_03150, partial [Planctomycetota bacterium]|nr:hypothetical protein [Planctomycetota bacterium]
MIEIAMLLSVLLASRVAAEPSARPGQDAPFPVTVVLRPLRQTFLRGEPKELAADFTLPPSGEGGLF